MHAPVADTLVELLEFPEAHDVILVLVERAEHAAGLLVGEAEFSFQHRDGLVTLQSPNVVLNVPVEYRLHLLPVTHATLTLTVNQKNV